jgi:hypothetical protein
MARRLVESKKKQTNKKKKNQKGQKNKEKKMRETNKWVLNFLTSIFGFGIS